MKTGAVHLCCLLLLGAVAAGAQQPPPGLVEWTSQTYTLDAGESMPFHVDFEQIPVRRWVLLVEGDTRTSYLNLRRQRDGSLIYDQRGESRHLVEIPWGEGEVLSGLLRAERQGAYAVSLWGPPRDRYLRAYSYDVNRALEDLERGDETAAAAHLMTALHEDPDDAVAQTLLLGIDGGADGEGSRAALAPAADPEALRRLALVRAHADSLRREGRGIAALDTLLQTLTPTLGAEGTRLIYADLCALYLDLGNPAQARAALQAAEALGLAEAEAAPLRERLEQAED